METAAKIFFYLFSMIVSPLVGGVVISRLWEWFVVPLGVASVGVLHAYGLAIVVSTFFVGLQVRMATDKEVSPITNIIATWLAMGLMLLTGYVVKLLM